MRKITKGTCKALIQWKIQQTSNPQNLTYNACAVKSAMLSDLLKEQGYLCAYTMQRITVNTAHIEHIYPRSKTKEQVIEEKRLQREQNNPNFRLVPKYQHLELEWDNLLATFPANGSCDYGEKQKENYDPENGFISPINLNVSSNFKFKTNGEIEGLTEEAKTTIDILKLNHELLKNNRKAKIETAVTELKKSKTSITQAQMRINNLRTLSSGKLEEYCEAVAQCLEKALKKKIAISKSNKSKGR